jgi:hypothetical protein
VADGLIFAPGFHFPALTSLSGAQFSQGRGCSATHALADENTPLVFRGIGEQL